MQQHWARKTTVGSIVMIVISSGDTAAISSFVAAKPCVMNLKENEPFTSLFPLPKIAYPEQLDQLHDIHNVSNVSILVHYGHMLETTI